MEHSIESDDQFIGIANVHDNFTTWFTDESIGIHDVKMTTISLPDGSHEVVFSNMYYGWFSSDGTSNPDTPYFGYDIEQTPDGYMIAGCTNFEGSVDLLFALDSADYWTPYTHSQGLQTCERSPQFFLYPYQENLYGNQSTHEGMSSPMGTNRNHGEMEAIYLPDSDQCVVVATYSSIMGSFDSSVLAYFIDYTAPPSPLITEKQENAIIHQSIEVSALQVLGTNRIILRIDSPVETDADIHLSLFDVSGRLVGELVVEGSSLVESSLEIESNSIADISSNGVYLLQVKIGSNTGTCTTVMISQ